MSKFREIWNGPSFLNRGNAACRMRMRDEAGKRSKKHKSKSKEERHEHFNKNWDPELWD